MAISFRTAAAARDEERRQVHAGNQKHASDRPRENHDRLARVRHQRFLRRLDAKRLRDGGIRTEQSERAVANGGELRRRLFPSRIGPKPGDDLKVCAAALPRAGRTKWRPQIGRPNAGETPRHDTYDRVRLAPEQNRLADDVRIAVEEPVPDVLAEHRDRRPAGPIFVVAERTALNRRDGEHSEVAGRHAMLADVRGRLPDDEIGPAAAHREHRGVKRGDAIAHRFPDRAVVRGRRKDAARPRRRSFDERQPGRIRIGQGPDQDRVSQAEDRRAGTNDERQRHDGRRGEGRRTPQDAHGIAEIPDERVDDWHPGHLVNLLELDARIPERESRFALGVGTVPAPGHQFFDIQIDMRAHLRSALPFPGAPVPPSAERHHTCPPRGALRGRSTRPTARASVSHRLVSASRCFRPFAVRR